MSFDHVVVAFSLLLSLGVVRLLDGLRASAGSSRYLVHTAWVGQKLLNFALYWCALWTLRGIPAWSASAFLWLLVAPSLMFVQASALVTTHPESVLSWRAHFFGIRRWFFTADVALITHSLITSTLLRDLPVLHWFRVIQGAALLISGIGLSTDRPRIHAGLAALAILLQLWALGTILSTA